MSKLGVFHFYPQRIAWLGAALLLLGLLLASPLLLLLCEGGAPLLFLNGKKEMHPTAVSCSFSLGLNEKDPSLPIPDLKNEVTFSFDAPRPGGTVTGQRLLVRLKRSSESKRVVLPCRLELEFQRDKLTFAKDQSPFWMELSLTADGQIEAKGCIASKEGGKIETGRFTVTGQDCPIQSAQEFSEGSPFRVLAEAKWWGKDLFRESGERLEVVDLIELKDGDWLVWRAGKWEKEADPDAHLPIAHVQSGGGKALVLEGWDSEGHIRISLNPAVGAPFKVKGEELFSAIRIRSEKQISCMLEKQCMVLKAGDWVLKSSGRWKVLRKEKEKEAFLNGKMGGELFVFDQISQRQGQKVMQGRLFNSGRTQLVNIEMAAQTMRKGREKGKKAQ